MKALVIGASGQVGGQLAAVGKGRGVDVVRTGFRNDRPGALKLDVSDRAAVRDVLAAVRPDVVFVPAAMTHVDRCETHPHECRAANVDGPRNVAEAAAGAGARVVFFSTEHVFPDGPTPYAEAAPCGPVSEYAKSKVLAEAMLREVLPGRHLILRTSWVYGPEEQGKNFVYRAVRTLRAGEALTVPADQHGQPTYGPDLAAAAWDLIEAEATGTVHVVGPELVTRDAFARQIAAAFDLSPAGIAGVTTAELRQPAPRPLHIQLTRDKLIALLGRDPIRPPAAALKEMRGRLEGSPGVRLAG